MNIYCTTFSKPIRILWTTASYTGVWLKALDSTAFSIYKDRYHWLIQSQPSSDIKTYNENQVNPGRTQSKRSCTYLSIKKLSERELTHYNDHPEWSWTPSASLNKRRFIGTGLDMYRIRCGTVKTFNKGLSYKSDYRTYTSDDFMEAHRSTLTLACRTTGLGLLWWISIWHGLWEPSIYLWRLEMVGGPPVAVVWSRNNLRSLISTVETCT